MTPNKLPPLPEPSDDDLPVPAFRLMGASGYGSHYVSEENIGDTDCYTADQLHAVRAQAFHDGQCEAIRQSQSLPAGAVAGGIRELSLSDYLRIEAERVEDPGLKDRLRKFSNVAEQQEAIPASELRDSFRWNALLNRIDTASAAEFGTLLNIIGDARAMGCGCLENYVDQIDVGECK